MTPYELSEALRPLSVRLGPTSGNDEIKKKVGFLSFGEIKKRRLDFYIFMIFILTAVDPSVLMIQSW